MDKNGNMQTTTSAISVLDIKCRNALTTPKTVAGLPNGVSREHAIRKTVQMITFRTSSQEHLPGTSFPRQLKTLNNKK